MYPTPPLPLGRRAPTTSRTDIDALTAEFAAQPPDVQSDAHRYLDTLTGGIHSQDYDVYSTLAVFGTWQADFDALASSLRAVAGWVVPQ